SAREGFSCVSPAGAATSISQRTPAKAVRMLAAPDARRRNDVIADSCTLRCRTRSAKDLPPHPAGHRRSRRRRRRLATAARHRGPDRRCQGATQPRLTARSLVYKTSLLLIDNSKKEK